MFFSIFNGRKRTLGEGQKEEIYMQVGVEFRKHLHLLKGANLSVFLCISLHSDQDGWSRPSIDLIAKETGYNRDTIFKVLVTLENLQIDGHRFLYRHQPRTSGNGRNGEYETNRYLIFPTEQEVDELNRSNTRKQATSQNGKEPCREKFDTENASLRKTATHGITMFQEEPCFKEETKKHTHSESVSSAKFAPAGKGVCVSGSMFSEEEIREHQYHANLNENKNNPLGEAWVVCALRGEFDSSIKESKQKRELEREPLLGKIASLCKINFLRASEAEKTEIKLSCQELRKLQYSNSEGANEKQVTQLHINVLCAVNAYWNREQGANGRYTAAPTPTEARNLYLEALPYWNQLPPQEQAQWRL